MGRLPEDKRRWYLHGGCRAYAEAIREKRGGDLHCIMPAGWDHAWHVVVQRDGRVYDAEGRTTPATLLRRWGRRWRTEFEMKSCTPALLSRIALRPEYLERARRDVRGRRSRPSRG